METHITIVGVSPARHNEPRAQVHPARQEAEPLGRMDRSPRTGNPTRRSHAMRAHDSKNPLSNLNAGESANLTPWRTGAKPLTAVLTFLIPGVRPSSAAVTEPSCPPIGSGCRVTLFRMLKWLVSAVSRSYLLDPPPPPPPLPPVAQDEKGPRLLDEIERRDAASLHVSVIVAMPTQRWCCKGPLETDASPRPELGEFCIGTVDVRWHEG
ncbi:hypothetical protein HD554DRAFT_954357 [Boletus coccyginus]|nr:hypothetical protein HD554DRAFT_954357 [Boletus coccyginus]